MSKDEKKREPKQYHPPKKHHDEVKRFRPRQPKDYTDPDYEFEDEEDIYKTR